MAARSLIPKSAAPIWFRSAREAVEHRRVESALAESGRLQRQLEDENAYLREQADTALAFGRVVGNSPALRRLLPQVELVAPTDATVLVLGESGSGKELFAREIHQRSRRAQRPLITVNCSAIPHEVSESEFFGHGKLYLDPAWFPKGASETPRPAPTTTAAEVVPDTEWRRRERQNLEIALQRAGGRIYGPKGAAELLGVKPTTVQSRLRALGIRTPDNEARR